MWFGFPMEMSSFSQALGQGGSAPGAPGQPVPFQEDGMKGHHPRDRQRNPSVHGRFEVQVFEQSK